MGQGRDIRWRRIREVFFELESRPVSRALFQSCTRAARLRLRLGRAFRRVLPRKAPQYSGTLKSLNMSRGMRVLIVAEDSIPQCYRYRVQQKLEQLAAAGVDASAVPWTEAIYQPDLARYFHIVIFYRVPGYPQVLDMIQDARSAEKLVFYETDDIIFDADIQREVFESSHRQISRKVQKQVLNGAKIYRAAMQACPYGIASTPALKEQMEKHMGQGAVFVHPNGLDALSNAVADSSRGHLTGGESGAASGAGQVRLFYGSGTRTHDADLSLIAPALAQVMQRFEHVHLVLAGHISLPTPLLPFKSRVERLPLLSARNYLSTLRYADINLAPLVSGVFADSKSEIKWLEAAILGVPTVASATRSFREAIAHRRTGLLAENTDAWVEGLTTLITDETASEAMGQAARQAASVKYRAVDLGKKLVGNLKAFAAKAGAVVDDARKAACFIGGHALPVVEEIGKHGDPAFAMLALAQNDMASPAKTLRYLAPDMLVITGVISDTEIAAIHESGIAHMVLLTDNAWLAGAENVGIDAETLQRRDPIQLGRVVPDLDMALNCQRRLRALTQTAAQVVALKEDMASLYHAAGFPCDVISVKELASSLVSGDKAP